MKLSDNYHIGSLVNTAHNQLLDIYITAVYDRRYLRGDMINVEQTTSAKKAEICHEKWLDILEFGEPKELKDIFTNKTYYAKLQK